MESGRSQGRCGVCGTGFEFGPVFAWINTDGGPDEPCERCLSHSCGWARSEGLDVPWKAADRIYADAIRRFPEPMTTEEEMLSMTLEEEGRILEAARLT